MKNVFIVNGHYPYPNRKGELNTSLVDLARKHFENRGAVVKITETKDEYVVEDELQKFIEADLVIWQFPVHWMGLPWRVKQYFDIVFTAGNNGELFTSDGRTVENPTANYGAGGSRQDTKYLLSATFNSPTQAFNAPDEYLFEGKDVEDLMFPIHMTMKFLGMQGLPTFSCHDVVKNPTIESDFKRYEDHLENINL